MAKKREEKQENGDRSSATSGESEVEPQALEPEAIESDVAETPVEAEAIEKQEEAPSVERQLEELEAECASLKDKWLRSEADFNNYRRRAARDLEEAEARAQSRVLAEVMSLADDLERALDAAEQLEKSGPIADGVRLVHTRLRDILASHGVEVIDPRGLPFDPHEAEALLEVDNDEQTPGTVLQVIEKGYRQGAKLLRAAKVTVARAPSVPTDS